MRQSVMVASCYRGDRYMRDGWLEVGAAGRARGGVAATVAPELRPRQPWAQSSPWRDYAGSKASCCGAGGKGGGG